ncbi:MAG: response regulator [Candidatus Delongbacteria bacterium]|nr:response regulator [Candidatus Delongbacteria bacterium]
MLNVAVIDDDILALRLMKDSVENLGYKCKIFNNPDTALAGIKNFDVVYVDYHLGRVNGKDLLKKIKSEKEDIIAIMISGYMIEHIVNKELKEMLYAFYSKPLDLNRFKTDLDAISKLLSSKN